MKTYLVENLDQLKLLSDDFKLKLIECFAAKPSTTKQVADRLGEKAPRLYRHVDQLVDAGLLILVDERQKRGTIERYYTPIAERFEVDSRLFANESPVLGESMRMVRGLFRRTERELLTVFEQLQKGECDGDPMPTLLNVAIDAPKAALRDLQARLNDLLTEVQEHAAEANESEPTERWSSLIALYPSPESATDEDEPNDSSA